ncbi:hypothetical protein J2S66_002136 [Saccharothrix longispora]|uniref:Uncharacterized protein n=1 Tax=Saccharothrix longispora TaxID=33920 RepID=A0ABU1PSX3_9PSEU|nr:hypothetical protein [Saccharothrix longispora]
MTPAGIDGRRRARLGGTRVVPRFRTPPEKESTA